MALKFRGESTHKVDAKGRVSIPASFRRVLERGDPDWDEGLNPNLVIVYGGRRRKFLECYTIEAMEEVEALIATLRRGTPKRRLLERVISGQSFATSVDETGRLVLPARLRERIGLEREAFFLGTNDTFQIWNPKTYEEDNARLYEMLEEQPEKFLEDDPDDPEEFDELSLLPDPMELRERGGRGFDMLSDLARDPEGPGKGRR